MLTFTGTKLLDFGLAKHTVGAAGQTLSMLATAPGTGAAQGTIIGTLEYMAPRAGPGRDSRRSHRQLRAWHVATGRRVFETKTQASRTAKILESDPSAVSTLSRSPFDAWPRGPELYRERIGGGVAERTRHPS